jgi:AhpD family alkylhydroperoxidase
MTPTATAPTSTAAVRPTTRMAIGKLSRECYRAMIALDDAVDFDPPLRELVRLRASILNGCAYCVDMHSRDALEAGEDPRRVATVAAWAESAFFTARERAAFALTDEITRLGEHGVSDKVWAGAAAHFDEPELAQLIWAIVVINAWNRIGVSVRMIPDDLS